MITLYELKGRDHRRYSLFSWRASLFGAAIGRGLSQTLNVWADRVLVPGRMLELNGGFARNTLTA